MTLRKMSNTFKGFNFYNSSFDPETGTLVRSVEIPEDSGSGYLRSSENLVGSVLRSLGRTPKNRYSLNEEDTKVQHAWARKFGRLTRSKNEDGTYRYFSSCHSYRESLPFSPVPETVDVKITDWCNGPGNELCSYCYMSSHTRGKHAPKALLETIFAGLKTPPYQIAFGGGEPTAHPDFPWFLEYTRAQGTVPNYTTAGHIMRPEVIEATNKYCGGVALTYHAFKGPEWFKGVYDKWKAALAPRVQLNVHVIFDDHVAESLQDLMNVGLRGVNLVLLAYYPNVGRADYTGVPSKGTYQVRAPEAIKEVTEKAGFRIAFSEGLLAYFLSHQLPEVDTRFAMQQEGLFSCYIDDHGQMSTSSFDPPDAEAPNIYKKKFQRIWETLGGGWGFSKSYDTCDSCKYQKQCHVPDDAHYMLCRFAGHNKTPTLDVAPRKLRLPVAV